ncbi:hypothetical protein [Arcticibacterium luteifluviistationis]|uniref:Uncharacterized protein n=1 Tax=Arcticibacterium luteifluviistationis TaxID=1784714 RepID=A0A2Z4G8R8_9BACT|nr:hypothetical protein [Arcticibacterium luteifluviistationis]AWV97629.1 hypothetical protein DJ013_05400 [Arcticibacterium luteifluviistationis]
MKFSKMIYAVLAASTFIFSSCEKDEDVPAAVYTEPQVTASSSEATDIEFGATGSTVTFNVSVDSDLTATYAATGNGVTVSNATGSVTGNTVEITFDAGAAAGAASVNLVVTDSQGKTSQATAVINIGAVATEVSLTSNISANTTWTSDKIYILGGRITVESGVTLTIEAGTIIKGQAGTGANATALLVARGGKIMAEGTATSPIIFTSIADEISQADIAAGNFASPNLDADVNGLWGGVIVLGNAPISASNSSGDVSEVQIEGIPTSDPNGLYGGSDAADNSGVLKYISIRHGGANIGSGNEINGLTLGGVGSGTVIENIEIVANQDDGIEWFGGTVNVSNVVVWNVGDDGIDTDQAWTGTLSNFAVITVSGHCFELDGPEGSTTGSHIIQNGYINAAGSEDLINTDDNSGVALKNLYFVGVGTDQKINRVTAPAVTFEGIELSVDASELASHVNGEVPAGVTAGTTNSADLSVLSWTWAAQSGNLQ